MKTYNICTNNCCPVIEVENDKVRIGEDTKDGFGGWTTMNLSQFRDFVNNAKSGKYDEV